MLHSIAEMETVAITAADGILRIHVDLTRDAVRHSPPYNPGALREPKQAPHGPDEKRACA